MACKRGKGACKRGKRGLPAGRKVPSCSLRPGARMNKGGRPYSCGRPPFYIGADGRISLSTPCYCLSLGNEKKSSLFFCVSLVFSSLDAQRRLSLTRTLRLQREVFRFAQGNSSALGKKKDRYRRLDRTHALKGQKRPTQGNALGMLRRYFFQHRDTEDTEDV